METPTPTSDRDKIEAAFEAEYRAWRKLKIHTYDRNAGHRFFTAGIEHAKGGAEVVSEAAIREATEPVIHWYESDEQPARPILEVLREIVADLQSDRTDVLRMRNTIAKLPHDAGCASLSPLNAECDCGKVAALLPPKIEVPK